jgi:hypothetical protein
MLPSTGHFSGVSLSSLTDTPALIQDSIFEASAEELPALGEGMKLEEHDGKQMAHTQEGFFMEFEVGLPVGEYSFSIQAVAPNRSSDSYWVQVDGKQIERPLALTVGAVSERSIMLRLPQPGKHKIRVELREAPGSAIGMIGLYRTSVNVVNPPMRQELRDRHPRIFCTSSDLDAMKARLNAPQVRRFYNPTGVLTRKPLAFRPGQRNSGSYRSLGSYAMSYLLEPDDEKLKGILEWLEMATAYPHCGVDLDAEYFMEGVALTYDWLYEYIPEELRIRVRDTIARQCREVYEVSLHGRTGGGLSFQQNHYWFAHLSMALGAAAIYAEMPETESWLTWAWDRFEGIALSFSPDGGFHEGPSYWDFSMPTLYMYTDLYEWCTGLRVPDADAGLRGQAEFRFHHLYPGLESSAALEDSGLHISRPPVRLLLWEAKRFKDSIVMGMAELLSRDSEWNCWNLLWFDETLNSQNALETLSPAKYYPDIETVFARTSWDDDATSVAFMSRPLGGHKWAELCSQFGLGGTGHNHPAQNHFIIFGRGQVLAADPGYTYEKRTRNHNTVLIDGIGQYGDGEMWPRPTPGRAHITGFAAEGDITIVTGDATSAYPKELGLKGFKRTLVLAGRDLVVAYDRLMAEEPKTFSWLLHHYGDLSYNNDGTWTVKRDNAQLGAAVILPERFTAEANTYRPQYIHPTRDLTPKEADVNLLELKAEPATDASFLVVLMIGDIGAELPEVENVSTSRSDAVRVGDTVVAFNRDEFMAVALPWGENLRTEAETVVARLSDGKRQLVTE